MDNQSFKKVMATLAETYSKNITPLTANIYWQSLKGFTSEQVEQALIRHLSDPETCQYWPQVGTLISKITGTEKQKQLMITDSAMTAWEFILTEIRRIGAYGNLRMDDKVALKAVQSIGGWRELCHSDHATLSTWKRKEFISAYETYSGASGLPDYLPGIGKSDPEKIQAKNALQAIESKIKPGD